MAKQQTSSAPRGSSDLTTIEGIQDSFRARDYVCDRSLATATFLALRLGRPLLLEGEAGVGKTELAKVLAASLGARLIRLQCYEGLDVNAAVYEWNYPRQMLEIRLLEARGEATSANAHDIFGPEFLIRRPLLQALEAAPGEEPPVLLIDEIDRADEEFEAYLLEILSDFQVTVPEIGTIKADRPPRVILTSNRTREVHDALKRRCLYHWIDYPSAQKEFEIVSARVPEAPERLAREVVGFVHRLREADLTKVPGIAETLDWAAALLSLGARELAPELVDETLGVVLKYEEDIRRVRGETSRQYLAEASAGPDLDMTPPADPTIVRSPSGGDVDGRRLLAEAVGFGRALRGAGLSIDLGAAVDYARALTLVDLGQRETVRAAGATVFVRRRDDRDVYDRVFDRWWRRRGRRLPGEVPGTEGPQQPAQAEEADGPGAPAPENGADSERSGMVDRMLVPLSDGDEAVDETDVDGHVAAPDAYSSAEALRHRDFDRMTPAELRDAERLVDLLEPRLELRRTRRHELHRHGRLLAPRAMFRRNLATGGQFTEWVWRRPVRRPRKIVVICDISGSMERHARLLLRFVQALSASSAVKTESFVFGTHLTRVTRLLRDRDRDRALAKVADTVNDWAGGTRIGESFRDFNLHWARRTLRSSGIVIVVSDGWDRGDPALVATETARLRRNCHRLVWLNPLAGTPGYEPLAGGMRAAFPYIDDFLPAGTVASLERLGEILAGVRSGDVRRSGEAAAAADAGARAGVTIRDLHLPVALGRADVDPAEARPLG